MSLQRQHPVTKTSFSTRSLLFILAAGAAAISAHVAMAAPGDLYSTDFTAGDVVRYSADGTQTTIASGFAALTGIAFDGKGNLFFAQLPGNTITKITPRGVQSTFATGLRPTGLVFDRFGNLFAGDETTKSVLRYAPDGTRSTVVSLPQAPGGLAFDKNGVLYVAQGNSGIVRIARGTVTTFASGLRAQGLAFNAAGDLFASDIVGGVVTRITPAGVKTPFASVPAASGLAFDRSGNLFVSEGGGSGSIMLVTPSGVVTTFATGGTAPAFLTFEPALHQLLNISTRGLVGTGDHVLIAGFIVGGDGQVDGKVIVRALGPSLKSLAGRLMNPTMTLLDSNGGTVATNDDWKTSQQAVIVATGVPPTDDRESAIVASLPSGSYTAIVSGVANTTGDAVVEVYNLQ